MKQKMRILVKVMIVMSLMFIFSCSDDNSTKPANNEPSLVFTPPAGTYNLSQNVTISCETSEAEIYYTLDGSDPTESSLLYNSPINISTSKTIKAKAFYLSDLQSEVVTGSYNINDNPNLTFVWGGTFNNGTADITVSHFYIGKYEITHNQYIEFLNSSNVAADGYMFGVELIELDTFPCAIGYSNGDFYFESSLEVASAECPVIEVTWYGAVAYSNWLSEEEGLTPCYDTSEWSCDFSSNGYRLPTEMEWMFAAKGGNEEPATGYNEWAGTNVEAELTNYAWYVDNSEYATHPVGTKLPNQLGIYDMSGNVYEWVNDRYAEYSTQSQTDPTGPSSGSFRERRGGSWTYGASSCTVSDRLGRHPDFNDFNLGFRIARRAE